MKESSYKYNSWPIGKVDVSLQRNELQTIKELGYEWSDARDVIDLFENKVAEFAGSKYAVTTDCCSHGVFLSLKYLQHIGEVSKKINITIPKQTYVSIPMQILSSGLEFDFEDLEWSGIYNLKGTRVWDGAVRWRKNMYVGDNALQVLSFQFKKRIPIGKGGIILTDDEEAAVWLKYASYDGRDLKVPYDDTNHIKTIGYHMYMTPEDAARGIILMDKINSQTLFHDDSGTNYNYPDLSSLDIFNKNRYFIYDMVSYGHMEELKPLSLIKQCSSKEDMIDTLNELKIPCCGFDKLTNKIYNK